MKEYKTIPVKAEGTWVETTLNSYTNEGWRLHTITESNEQGAILLVLERDVEMFRRTYNN